MKKQTNQYLIVSATFLLVLFSCGESKQKEKVANEPPNFGIVTNDLLDYYNSGTYLNQVNAMAAEISSYLESAPSSGFVVLDIDDTSVSNAEMFVKTKFCQTSEWGDWLLSAKAPAIKSIHEAYEKAIAKGLKVVFITARDEGLREVTEKNLAFAEYTTYDTLILKNKEIDYPSSAAYKTAVRKALVESGETIVLNVGDQESDISGGFASKTFKLPNPFYFTK